MMNFIYINYDIRNKKNAPEEPDLCKKQVYREVGIPEEYYLPIVISFSVFPWDLYLDLLSLI
ncbi:hypothetical protein [Elizabethkingia anophelis]|uniref:hypothetical protein n=1 Tax=Elizabethkingia anophelis TaxID=1117645 RepID=UPI000559997D|nr:hypothetical protein [Elizabethkingia anophelis]MCT3787865.1 hypothetical protein [Elizabethkingia anophelis]PKR31246.1 hypothetical protein CWH99_10720 [Elizabethkingia anophelis]